MFRLVVIICLILAFVSCRPKYHPEPLFQSYNDFENYTGWGDVASNAFTVSYGDAYRGNYAVKVNGNQPFGAIFKIYFEQIPDERPTRLVISAMYKVTGKELNNAAIVCNIMDSVQKPMHWIEFPLKKESKIVGKWLEFKEELDITWVTDPKNSIAVFLWNHDSNEEVLIDDLLLQFY